MYMCVHAHLHNTCRYTCTYALVHVHVHVWYTHVHVCTGGYMYGLYAVTAIILCIQCTLNFEIPTWTHKSSFPYQCVKWNLNLINVITVQSLGLQTTVYMCTLSTTIYHLEGDRTPCWCLGAWLQGYRLWQTIHEQPVSGVQFFLWVHPASLWVTQRSWWAQWSSRQRRYAPIIYMYMYIAIHCMLIW